MADQFQIIPYKVRSAGTDVPPEEVQAAVNSLALQTTIALNSVASDPTGPAGGDLSGTYPNPTVVKLHVTSGTESGVAITASTVDSTPVGATTPSTGAFTTATAGSLFASGGAVPAVTATGTQIYNSPNPTVQFIDSIRSANNKNAFVTWGSTVLAFGFANDAFTSFTNALAITGGQAAGISGITSTSGTGAWAHTGGFSATGGINSTAIGATTPSTGAFTTLSASSGINSTPVGATTPSTGSFTTLAASGAVSGAGFTARFASPGPIGNTAASTGAFTTLTASTAIGVASGGTGLATLTAHAVLLGEGTSNIAFAGPGATAGTALISTGATTDPVFGLPTGTLVNIQRFAAGGTYTPTAGTNSVIVRIQGAGGAGGGAAATGAGQTSGGASGGAGGYIEHRMTSGFSGATVTVGTGGTGVSGAAGNAGTSSSFAGITAGGGAGGTGVAAATAVNMGATAGGTATGGSILNAPGAPGPAGFVAASATNFVQPIGASSTMGGGGLSGAPNATGFGAGGVGMINGPSAAATAGGNGSAGLVLVYEYA